MPHVLKPTGVYLGRLEDVGLYPTKKTENLPPDKQEYYMGMVWNIVYKANGEKWDTVEEFKRNVRLSMSEKALVPYTFPKLDAMGWNGDPNNPDFSKEIKDEWVHLRCEHRNGYEDWSLVIWDDLDSGSSYDKSKASLPVDKAGKLANRFESFRKGHGSDAPTGKAPNPPADNDSDSDFPVVNKDEIPF